MSDHFAIAGSIAGEDQPASQTAEVYVMPCSYAQQRLWFIDRWQPGAATYNMSVATRLVGSLSAPALESALNQLVSRHESLRTAFALQDGEPFQHILPNAAVQMPLRDLSGREPARAQSEALGLAQEFAQRPFDLSAAPLLRALLIRIDPQEHLLVLVLHHIVSDGWSMGVLYGELSTLYQAQLEDRQAQLPPLPIQYADYALWQREQLQGQLLERELGYWRKRLDGLSTLELPTDRPRPPRPSYRGASQPVYIEARLSEALKRLARAQQCTPFMALLTAFATLLQRYSGLADIAVGSPIAGRNRSQLEGLIGFFVNTLVLRTDASGDPSFLELLARVRECTLDAYAHQELPFEKLVQELRPQRDPSRNPLTQVMFALQNTPGKELSLPGLRCCRVQLCTDTAKFDLTLSLSEEPDGLRGQLEYATDLFEAGTIERMVGHWRVLLEAIVADPGQAISQLPLLTEAERRQLLIEWNDTAAEYPRDRCIHQLFEAQVERTPEATALVYETQQLTYGELNARANRLAHHLRSLGVGPEVLVGVCLERSLELVVGLLAILKAGGAYVPLDPGYPAERLAFMLQDTQAPVLLTEQRSLARLPAYAGHTLCLDRDAARIAQHPETNPPVSSSPTNLAYVIYTSGSTGKPKGVMVEQHSVVNYLSWIGYEFPLSAADRVLQKTPISFDASVEEIFFPLTRGAVLVIAGPDTHWSTEELIAAVQENGITILQVVPSLLASILDHAGFRTCNSLRLLLCGAEILPRELAERVQRQSTIELVNLYGPTETTISSTFWKVRPNTSERSVPIGHPIANTKTVVVDNAGQLLPAGIPGQLCLGGAGVSRGYLNRPDLTRERFVPDRFWHAQGGRLYLTGDRARLKPDGTLEFLGRCDQQLKIRGFRIEPEEVEAALSGHTGVADVAVVGHQIAPGSTQLVAYFLRSRKSDCDSKALRAYLQARLPEHMIPAFFVALESLPRLPNGKVDRSRLPAPGRENVASDDEFVAPSTPVEQMLIDVWRSVLQVDQIGIHHNFFEIGGHSLLAAQVVARIREAHGAPLSIRDLFANPTVAALSRIVETLRAAPPLEQEPGLMPAARQAFRRPRTT
jgi:amino acid adenylation domain-containing protein